MDQNDENKINLSRDFNNEQVINGFEFSEIATNVPHVLSKLIGTRVEHITSGIGIIEDIEQRLDYIPLFTIKFLQSSSSNIFNSDSFKENFFKTVNIPRKDYIQWKKEWTILQKIKEEEEVILKQKEDEKEQAIKKEENDRKSKEEAERARLEAEEIAIKNKKAIEEARIEAEEEAIWIKKEADLNIKRKSFEEIANRYQIDVKDFVDDSGPTQLAPIVLKIENKEILVESEIKWLKSQKYFNLLGMYYFLLYEHKIGYIFDFLGGLSTPTENDYWNLAKACSNFRDAKNPQKTIEISNDFLKNESKIESPKSVAAVFTSRGGALKDIGNIEDAKRNAFKAIQLSSDSFYPYNLLGSIYYLENDCKNGDKYFSKAIDLGSSPTIEKFELKKILEESEQNNRKSIIEYLLNKDPNKYSWVIDFK